MRNKALGVVAALAVVLATGWATTSPAQADGDGWGGGTGNVGKGDQTPPTNGHPHPDPGGGVSYPAPTQWTETTYVPTCGTNAPQDGDALCGAAVNTCNPGVTNPPGGRQIRMWVYTRTDYADGRPPTAWQMQPGSVCIGADTPPPPAVDPVIAARQVFATMHFNTVGVGIVPEDKPGSEGLVGLPTWMWVDNAAGLVTSVDGVTVQGAGTANPTYVVNQEQDGLAVQIEARFAGIRWDLGDGTVKNCGMGTPYRDSDGTSDSPDCGYRYPQAGVYTVTATPQWTVTWRVARTGDTGQFNVVVPVARTQVRVAEMQVLGQK